MRIYVTVTSLSIQERGREAIATSLSLLNIGVNRAINPHPYPIRLGGEKIDFL